MIKGKNITLKNAVVRGFKVAIFAEGVDSLRLIDCDFSYNWRPRLRSIRELEDFSDWLSFHQNDQDEWLCYTALRCTPKIAGMPSSGARRHERTDAYGQQGTLSRGDARRPMRNGDGAVMGNGTGGHQAFSWYGGQVCKTVSNML